MHKADGNWKFLIWGPKKFMTFGKVGFHDKAKSNYRGYNQIFIHFFIDNSSANISLHSLSCPKLKFEQLKA